MERLNQKKLLMLPRFNLNERQLCDLELILNGGFSPLKGFLNKDDYEEVVEKMRLKDGSLWPIPVVLDCFEKKYRPGDEIILCDQYGVPLALMKIASIYKPNKQKEALMIYGTKDQNHFGVNYLLNKTGDFYLGGKIKIISPIQRNDFSHIRHDPKELKKWFKQNNWKKIIGFQTRNPIHKVHFEIIKKASQKYNAKVLIHPAVGLTKDDDIHHISRIKIYEKIYKNYAKNFAKLSLLPISMRMAGPREALWHAIIRKNYGCTHFIIGRDHAGPGKDRRDISFYPPYEAQTLVQKYEKELGIKIIATEEMVYLKNKKNYFPISQVKSSDQVQAISGTEFRYMLRHNKKIPEWFSFPEIVSILQKEEMKNQNKGLTIFFTGLSGAGKSTIASLLTAKLLETQNKKITLLDGDIVRQNLSRGLGFSRKDRNINIERIGFVANEITKHGGIAVCSAIAPYRKARRKNRKLIEQNGPYIEIYISTPINICKKRDTKGLYKKAEMGELKNFTGINDPYEEPQKAEIILDTSKKTKKDCVDEIIKYLKSNIDYLKFLPLRSSK